MNMKKNNSKKDSTVKSFFEYMGKYIKVKYPYLIIAFIGFLLVSLLNFAKISTVQTVASFTLEEYEIGQISDRTIIAEKDLPPDEINPVSILKGEKIIKKGFPITEENYSKLQKMAESPLFIDYRSFANGELFIFLLVITWFILFSFVPGDKKIEVRESIVHLIFFLILYAMTAFLGKFKFFNDEYSICMILPTSMFIMLITILYGNISAVIISFMLSFGVLNACGWYIPTFIYSLANCLTSAIIVRKIDKRIDLILASLIVSVLNAVYMVLILVIFNEEIASVIGKLVIGVALNGLLSGVLTLGLLTPLEMVLNTASVFRLMDLSDVNNPLLRKMMVQASGSYQHSMMVAQLAESACREINANSLLARVGAYYHDIGKVEQPEYFTENNFDGKNKHDELNPTMSASVIKSHVRKGVEKAYELRMPKAVINIISEHHGNDVIGYFYNKGVIQQDESLTPEDFSYPGNPPSSKESAVVMLADTVEAACRSLDNPTVPRLEKFITTLVNGKMERKQLDNCDLTFRDITKIKDVFVQILGAYYHTRIKYPNQKDPDADKTTEKASEKSAEKGDVR